MDCTSMHTLMHGDGGGYSNVTNQRLQVHIIRMCPYDDASLKITEELREAVARIYGECELRIADVLNIGQYNDGTSSV